MKRRDVLKSLSAAAAASRAADGYSLDEEWDEEPKRWDVERITAEGGGLNLEVGHAALRLDYDEAAETLLEVVGDRDGHVLLHTDINAHGVDVFGGETIRFDPATAHDLAVAIVQAAEDAEKAASEYAGD